jgi:hypothetical protein
MTDQVENVEAIEEGTIAQDSLKPASKLISDPKSRIEMMTAVLKGMDTMPKKDLVKWFDQAQAVFGPGKDYGVGDKSGSNQSSIDMKGGSGPKTRDAMPKLHVKEDVEDMFADQELTEEFKERVSTVFEAAVAARAIVEEARLEEEFETKLTEAVAEINEELTSKVDTYLDYVVEQWMEDNAVAIESTLRNELASEFIEGLKGLFAEHYIDVPQEKIDVIESLAEKIERLEFAYTFKWEEKMTPERWEEICKMNLDQYMFDRIWGGSFFRLPEQNRLPEHNYANHRLVLALTCLALRAKRANLQRILATGCVAAVAPQRQN